MTSTAGMIGALFLSLIGITGSRVITESTSEFPLIGQIIVLKKGFVVPDYTAFSEDTINMLIGSTPRKVVKNHP